MKFSTLSLVTLFLVASTTTFSQEKKNKDSIKAATVATVLNKYVDAIGGTESLQKIENKIQKTSMMTSMNMGGKQTNMESKMIQAITKEGKIVSITGVDDALQSKVYFDGNEGYTYLSAFGSKTPFDQNMIDLYKRTIRLFPNTDNLSTYSKKVTVQNFNGEQCYELTNKLVTTGIVTNIKEYYSVKTGLLIGSYIKNKTSESTTYITDYREINGVLTSLHQTSNTKVTGGTTMLSSVKTEEITYNGMIDSYFADDNEIAARQIASIPMSKSKHEEKFKSIGGVVTNTDIAVVDSKDATGTNTTKTNVSSNYLNKRDQAFQEILKNKGAIKKDSTVVSTDATVSTTGKRTDVEDLEDEYKDFAALKYRRSSLYTLMINDQKRELNNVIRNAFGDTELSPKFNNHNIGPYLIPGKHGEKDQTQVIEGYLNKNNVARELVAKWFNRQPDGSFNMDLVAARGQYNASDLSKQLADNSIRGKALLKDAGTELIGNTFIIVYDYKYTNKEKTAKKRGGFLNAIASVASFIPGADDIASVAQTAKLASDVIGKGYYVRTTTYLYKLVWDDETADNFYSNYWVDASNPDSKRSDAFDKTSMFKLKYVGSEVSRNNLQSTIFTTKSNDQLIEIATIRAVDKNIGKLQRTFEEFRVKTPLLSGDPISAKIGLKEGIEKGDKFEVLEQMMDEDGITSYKRVGVIKVDKNNIWDNLYLSDEAKEAQKNNPKAKKTNKVSPFGTLFGNKKKNKKKKKKKVMVMKKDTKQENKPEYTIFTGKSGKFYSGMLIRQIN
tara:strand:+ start:586 stop:2934 length:2349 start_codon:yes stop_codon:yes gene_type:complete